MDKKNKISNKSPRFPPVVAVLGHVDHGKTTLLDAIRKTNVAQKEVGGITQAIGASYVEIEHEGELRRITFIDTPGHEAFTKMRSRGVEAADLSLLVISSVDGVMPQTRESIKLLKEYNAHFIVVLTKSDLPTKSTEKVKQQLLKEGVLLEGLGGDVPYIEVSAKTGKNIKELLELILLVFDLILSTRKFSSESNQFKGVVIESRMDQKVGPKATVIIKDGNLSRREEVVCEGIFGKTRALINPNGKQEKNVTIGDAIEILGFEKVPPVGGVVFRKREISGEIQPSQQFPQATQYKVGAEKGELFLILCADTFGSLEAIKNSLTEDIKVILEKTGEITPSDILLAKSTKAIVIGFRAKLKGEVITMAKTEKVPLKNYSLIYELLDEINDVLEGKRLTDQEQILGKAKILASFPFEKTKVMGVTILEGRVAKGDLARLTRGDNIIGESMVSSLRQGKNPTSKIETNVQGGVILSPFLDFTIGDVLIFHR